MNIVNVTDTVKILRMYKGGLRLRIQEALRPPSFEQNMIMSVTRIKLVWNTAIIYGMITNIAFGRQLTLTLGYTLTTAFGQQTELTHKFTKNLNAPPLTSSAANGGIRIHPIQPG